MEANRDSGKTPLMEACRLHHVELVRALLEQDAAVYLGTPNGDTAMHFLFRDWYAFPLRSLRPTADTLVRADHTHRILQLLLDRGADANEQVQ
jgi:hypothetical protein